MGALGNFDHERFCEIAHRRIWSGEKRATAITAAYREVIYRGENSDDKALAPDARRLANRKDIKARLIEKADYASKLSGIDAGWALVQLKGFVECNLDDYLTPAIPGEPRFVDISRATREQVGRLIEVSTEENIVKGRGEENPWVIRRTRIKKAEPTQALALMSRIAGWDAPQKIAATDPSGEHHAPLAEFSLTNVLMEIDGSGRGIPSSQGTAGQSRVEAGQPLLDSGRERT